MVLLRVDGPGFDCRIPATVDLEKFKAQLDEWTSEEGVSYKLVASTNHKCGDRGVGRGVRGAGCGMWPAACRVCGVCAVRMQCCSPSPMKLPPTAPWLFTGYLSCGPLTPWQCDPEPHDPCGR
jgi:hypothetical protein